jgi:hypothetical protein
VNGKRRQGVPFDAIRVEIALDGFLRGPRKRLSTHADMFRIGDPRYLGRILVAIGKEIEARSRRVPFWLPERTSAGSRAKRLEGAIKMLKETGAQLAQRGRWEPNDYHWLIVGALTMALDAVLGAYQAMPNTALQRTRFARR